MDPDKINDADRQLEARILESGNGYAVDNAESKKLNKSRTKRRNEIAEMGFRTDAYQAVIHVVKDLTPAEAKAYIADFATIYKILSAKQADLFPDEQLRAAKRVEKAAAKAAGKPRTPAEIDAANANNPRSDPNSGGAKPQTPPNPPGEQDEGDKVIEANAPKMSQSQKAAQKRAAAKLDG